MTSQKNLRERCHVNTNDEGDNFVGIKADTDDAIICFPIGYQLPPNDNDLRADINNLLLVLSAFMKEDKVIEQSSFTAPDMVQFPIHAYLTVIRDYLRTGHYYIESEPQFKTNTKGDVSWTRTVRNQKPLVQKNGSFIFTKLTVRSKAPNENRLITQIHKYCVYEAFEKLGWLYVPFMPEKPETHPENKEAIYILEKKLASTHNDLEQQLFSAMVFMLQYLDEKSSEKQYFFGTDYFERVWEKMINRAFGIENKDQYFPRTHWYLDYGPTKSKVPLQPDSIMIYNGKIYVLDAKLYRYGITGNPDHLPNGPDINKQITYGEYIERAKSIPNDNLYNAFIMPFNKENHNFSILGSDGVLGIKEEIGNIGEALGDWKPSMKNYERIQGIVIDTRFLMYNYINMPKKQKLKLANAIEKVNTRPTITKSMT